MSQLSADLDFWNREVVNPIHSDWMGHLQIRHYLNASIGGGKGTWPFDWFQSAFPAQRHLVGLSIGCGTGALERDTLKRGICKSVDAFDGSISSIDVARQIASTEGLIDFVHYFVADFNKPILSKQRYDIVFFHQSLHHVAKLEKVLRAVLYALKPNGVLYLDEFVGPSRTFWTEETIQPYRELYSAIPEPWRRHTELPLPIQNDDPSEAIRSAEIMTEIFKGFDILEKRDYGGNLLAILLPSLHLDKVPEEYIDKLIGMEKALLAEHKSAFYSIVVAAPKRGMKRPWASFRYFLEPKILRLIREMKSRLRPRENP